jgi:hypothetical protein
MGQFVHPLAREQVKRDGQPQYDGGDNENRLPGSQHKTRLLFAGTAAVRVSSPA